MTAEGPPRLEVVIVAYRSRDLLRACLQSLQRWPPAGGAMTVHVVDNASGDGTADMVAEDFGTVRLYRLQDNAGFSRANNVALLQTRADRVLLLNPDTELRRGVLDHILAQMDGDRRVGMSGCRLERRDGTFDHAAKRAFPTPLGALAHFTGVGRRAQSGALSQYRATGVGEHDVGEVDAVNGAFMMIRREALEEVGLLDEGYWLYMEDLDWCYRFHRHGWKVLYDGRVTALHVKGASSGSHRRPRQDIAFHRGMGRFYRKFQAGRRPAVDAAVYVGIGAKLSLSLAQGALARARGHVAHDVRGRAVHDAGERRR